MVFGKLKSHMDYINNDDTSITIRNDWNVLFVCLFSGIHWGNWGFKNVFTLQSSLPMVEEKVLLL